MSNSRRKACVVGGGPAGLAAAIALAREGYGVTVVDCAVPPIDKACGEGLLPGSIAALQELGVSLPSTVGHELRGIRFASVKASAAAVFPADPARGVRRTVLQNILIRHASSVGVTIHWGSKRAKLADGGVSIDGQFIPADLIVGADGQNSQIRRQASLDRTTHEKRRYAFRRHYRVAPWSPYVEVHWGPRAQIYITPIAADEVGVAVISRIPALRLDLALHDFPRLRERLAGAAPASPEMGALSVSRNLRRVYRDKVVLLGDASGSVDAITGEGLGLAFRQALALAQALRSSGVAEYQRLHRKLMRQPQAMGALMLSVARNQWFQNRTIEALSKNPDVFHSFLAVHVGSSSALDLCSRQLLRFGGSLLVS